jgi:protein-arginine kinase
MARRNFKDYPFTPMMSTEMKVQVEKKVMETLGELYGTYHHLSKIDGKVEEWLNGVGICLDKKSSHNAAGINDDWPNGRGVFVDDSYSFVMLVNFEDHLQILATAQNGDISKPLNSISKVMTKFEKLGFSQDNTLGFLTASPKSLGTGLELHARIHTHTNMSEKTTELILKSYNSSLTKS